MSFIQQALCVFVGLACLQTLVLAQSTTHDTCPSENGTYGTPEGKHRLCTVGSPISPNSTSLNSQWLTVGNNDGAYATSICPGFVGMNLTYKCLNGALLYKDGIFMNGSSVNYGYLLPIHAGVYNCTGTFRSSQKLIVNEAIQIGGTDTRDSTFVLDSLNMCCKRNSVWSSLGGVPSPLELFVYGENATVTVEQVKWLVDFDTRNEVDLQLSAARDSKDPVLWYITVGMVPKKIVPRSAKVLIRVNARNEHSTHSVCFQGMFDSEDSDVQVEDNSSPMSTAVVEGHDAFFTCQFSFKKGGENVDPFYVDLEFSSPVLAENGNRTYNSCSINSPLEYPHFYSSCPLFLYNATKEDSDAVSNIATFIVQVPNVSIDLDMSTFSCSLVRRTSQVHSLQWKRVANLTVTKSLGKNSHIEEMFWYLFAILLLVIVIVAVVVAVLVVVCIRRRKSRHKQVNPDQVPLTCNSVHSSRSTLCGSEANTPITQFGRLPCVEISESHGRQRNDGLVVNEQYPPIGSMETHSSDSGVAMNSSTEDMYGNTFPTSIRQSPPFSLHIPRDIHHRRIDTSDKFDLSQFDKFVVYISYTNQMSDWVRNDLKPLIESWHTAIEVNIHENSMIPGYSVSGERHRLILEADKIVIVVSRDYSTSSWCVYELEHAIHQQPALCNGRVIPILTDNCNSLPGIISGVVCLGDDEPDFEGRLRHAILKKPQGSLVRV